MKKWSSLIFGAACLFVFLPSLRAQAISTATRSGSGLQVGAGLLRLNNDESFHLINYGITAWADYDFYKFIGVEAEAHFGSIKRADGIGQDTYLVGPRFTYHRRKIGVYGKFLYGHGIIKNEAQQNIPGYTNSGYTVYAYGGGVEYRVSHHLNVRPIDIEEQKYPDFYPHTLSPIALSFGASYVIR